MQRSRYPLVAVVAIALAGCGGSLPGSPSTTTGPGPLPAVDPSEVTRGRQVYAQQCAGCHGQNAEGAPNWQQLDARGNLPPPPHDDRGHTWRHGDAQLAAIIREGMRDPFNRTPELTMPPFKDGLSDEEVAAVIAYFKSLWSADHRRFQEEENRKPTMPMSGGGG
ncbi:MAG: cytochrome c [Chloroflexi bacterium]|nr:cytochrome c [Chloroflexota bacterium]